MHNVVLQEHMDELNNTNGVSFKDSYITANIRKDFIKVDFSNAKLQDIKIEDASFVECNFSEATISADITNTKFIGCNFQDAILLHTHIHNSIITDNDFTKAYFRCSSISQTELSRNDFIIAQMDDVKLHDISVTEPNFNENTITYDYPGATRAELEKMEENFVNELSGYAGVMKQVVNEGIIVSEQTIDMQLKPEEILMVKECVEEYKENGLRTWQSNICDSLTEKLDQAYQKPVMTQQEFQSQLDQEKEYWTSASLLDEKGTAQLVHQMVHAKRQELKFYNEINDYDKAIDEAMQTAEQPEPDIEMEV